MSRRSKHSPKPQNSTQEAAPKEEETETPSPASEGPWIVRSETMVRLPGSQITWVRPGKVIRRREQMELLKQQGVLLEALS